MVERFYSENGAEEGLVLSFDEGERWTIGKKNGANDIVLIDSKMADNQAVCLKTKEGFFIQNVDNKTVILVNSDVVKFNDKKLLKAQDKITMGETTFSFMIDDDEESFIFEDLASEPQLTQMDNKPQSDKKKRNGNEKGNKENTQLDLDTQDPGKPSAQMKKQAVDEDFNLDLNKMAQETGAGSSKNNEEDLKLNMDKVEQEAKEGDLSNKQPDQGVAPEEEKALDANSEKPLELSNTQTPAEENKSNEAVNSDKKDEESIIGKKDSKVMDEAQADKLNNQNNQDAGTANPSGDINVKENADSASTPPVAENKPNPEPSVDSAKVDAPINNEPPQGSKIDAAFESHAFDLEDLFAFDQELLDEQGDKRKEAWGDEFVDLSASTRFLLKIIAGPNIGAEFYLDVNREYVVGLDSGSCDIVFNDISVSHQHAKITISEDGKITLEDLKSKNGVAVDGEKVSSKVTVDTSKILSCGTTLFLIIDKQSPAQTIIAPSFAFNADLFKKQEAASKEKEKNVEVELSEEDKRKKSTGFLILSLFIGAIAVLFGVGTASLFDGKDVSHLEQKVDFEKEINSIVKDFLAVRYTYNKISGQLFIFGHVKTNIDKSELLYKLNSLSFIRVIDEEIVDDESVWQEINIYLSKQLEFKSVCMQSPEPGVFVLNGFVKTEAHALSLREYLNLNFNYLSALTNNVIIEKLLIEDVNGKLLQGNFTGVTSSFSSGELVLTGYVNTSEEKRFIKNVQAISEILGVRVVKNFVVFLAVEEGIIDLNRRYPNRYRVTGYSKHGDMNVNVVINGKILTRGDVLDGMVISGIQSKTVFLDKDGLKYKIDYNK